MNLNSATIFVLIFAIKSATLAFLVTVVQVVGNTFGGHMDVPVRDPWFLIFVGWWIFSSITAGMPEPTKQNSDNYLWAYRTMHIMSASGTTYFKNKLELPDERHPMKGD